MVGFVKRKVKTLTLGEKLKRIRERSGVSLAEIASNTKIKKEYLEKIEANNFENLPFDVYVKGYLRSYAKYIGLDSNEVIKRFEKEVGIRNSIKKYQTKTDNKDKFKMPSVIITPKIVSVLLTIIIILFGSGYFYLEVSDFNKKPNLQILSPNTNEIIKNDQIEIAGKTDFENKIFINKEPIYVNSEGEFEVNVGLQKGLNEIVIEALNKLGNNSKKIVNVVADYNPGILGAESDEAGKEEKEKKEEDTEKKEGKFKVKIESRETASWISLKIDQGKKQSSLLHPGTRLEVQAKKEVEISSGKANHTYVKIGEDDFFVIDKKVKGFKKIVLDKNGVILDNQKKSEDDNKN